MSSTSPEVIVQPSELQDRVVAARRAGRRVGLIPTMGALHEGHLSLVRAARAECEVVVATIFVNPTQFGPQEDLSRYPRTFADDLAKLADCGVDLVFAPAAEAMYPPGFSTYVEPPASAGPLEGVCRPGHFRGVATVVLKLFMLAPADSAYFGQKDYQQAAVIRHLVADLNVPIEVRVLPTVREPDGLAMSSRNAYLTAEQRGRALALWRALEHGRAAYEAGRREAMNVLSAMRQELLAGGVDSVEYVAAADPDTLQPVDELRSGVVLAIAARVGATRLIDNVVLT